MTPGDHLPLRAVQQQEVMAKRQVLLLRLSSGLPGYSSCRPAEQGLCADSLLSLRDPDDKSSGPPSLFQKSLQNSFFTY
ncbi:MAG: hypothetical protein JRG73_03705 [Deltaproteobacteria bacterium]|nr:hypothetical protein [Deltaproteobacteria bacterium]MBW2306018.1 hypothetical protein [Deltaproteobacteria bacterium]